LFEFFEDVEKVVVVLRHQGLEIGFGLHGSMWHVCDSDGSRSQDPLRQKVDTQWSSQGSWVTVFFVAIRGES
jgi:hypothetical protein